MVFSIHCFSSKSSLIANVTALVLERPPLELAPGALLDLGERRLRGGEEAKASLAVAFSRRVCSALIQRTRASLAVCRQSHIYWLFFSDAQKDMWGRSWRLARDKASPDDGWGLSRMRRSLFPRMHGPPREEFDTLFLDTVLDIS